MQIFHARLNPPFQKLVPPPMLNEHAIVRLFITPHAQRERGYSDRGWCPYMYTFVAKKLFESCFSDRLTLLNIHSRTSRRIYRLALPLRTPETLSSLTKSQRLQPWLGAFSIFLPLFQYFGIFFYRYDIQQTQQVGGGQTKFISQKTFLYIYIYI